MRCRSRSGFGKKTKMETVVDEEWRHLGGFLGSVVVYEFCKWKQFELVILFIIAKDAEVGFKGLVHSFRLTIYLRVEYGGF